MLKAQKNDRVTVEFIGTTEDGAVFDQADKNQPLRFELGCEEILPAFSDNLIGLQEGDSKTFSLAATEAFGEHREELVQELDRSVFGNKIAPQPGMILGLNMEKDGKTSRIPAQVVKVDGNRITVDYNHPLAGKSVTYEVTIIAIDRPSLS